MNERNDQAIRLRRMVVLITLLTIAWLLWSGMFKPLLLGLGALSCVITLYLTHRMGYFQEPIFALRFGSKLLGYWGWLLKEIWRSSLDVARIVLDPRLPIDPQVVKIKATANHPVDQAILGNSITLTPGTLSLDVYRGIIQVHCLTSAGADDLKSGEMDRRVAALRQR